MAEDLPVTKLFRDLISTATNTLSDDEIEKKFSWIIGNVFGIEKVVINSANSGDIAGNELYGYITNTKKTYVDNQLSEYSSFPELVGYKNRGFRSCAVVPIIVSGKVVSVVELLSLSENKFSNELINSASLGAYFTGLTLLYKYESDKSFKLASYFNSAFNTAIPQLLVSQDNRIVKVNDKARKELFDVKGQNSDIKDILGMGFSEISSLKGSTTVQLGSGKQKKIYRLMTNNISDKLVHVSLLETTDTDRFAKVIDAMDLDSHSGVMYLDKEFIVTFATDSIKSAIGYDAHLVSGRSLIELAVERQRGELTELLGTIEGREKIHGKVDLSSGSGIPSHINFTLSKWNDGYIMLFTEAEAEGYLQSIGGAFTDFINSTSDIVITMDAAGYIKECNMPIEGILGYSRSELVGRDARSLYADQSIFDRDIAYVRNGGKIDNSYVTLSQKSGSRIDATHSIRLFSTSGSADYIIVIKELETKRKLNDLDDRLAREESRITKLKATGDLKSQFIYNISHELKTPLTNIKGFSKLLYQGDFGPLNKDQLNYINTIIEEAERLMLIIQQVLDAAKLESQKMTLEFREVDMKELENNPTIQSMKESALNKGLKFSWIVDYDLPKITADPNRLIQVFVNLIGNAVKFTDRGEIKVRISKKTKNSVQCEVTDTGIGISEEDRHKLFKKFYEAPKKGLVKQEGAGTGLGLSIAREIVKLHGGTISCESEVDKGSKFYFTLRVKPKPKKKELA